MNQELPEEMLIRKQSTRKYYSSTEKFVNPVKDGHTGGRDEEMENK